MQKKQKVKWQKWLSIFFSMDEKVRGLLTQSHGLAHKHALENKDACAAGTARIILSSNLKKKKRNRERRSRTLMGASKLPPRPRPVLNSDVQAARRRCATLSNLPQPPPGRNPDTAHIYASSRTHGWMRMDGRGQTLPLRSKLTSTNSKPFLCR